MPFQCRKGADHSPMATCIAGNPRDLNIFLIGYEGGVVAYNIQKSAVEKQFEMFLPPGAPGGGSYQDADGVRIASFDADHRLETDNSRCGQKEHPA